MELPKAKFILTAAGFARLQAELEHLQGRRQEVAGNIRSDEVWFYHPTGNCTLKTVDVLFNELTTANAGHTNLLLDVTPDDRDLIPQCQVDRLKELKARIGP